jgi:hypothetical protein
MNVDPCTFSYGTVKSGTDCQRLLIQDTGTLVIQ